MEREKALAILRNHAEELNAAGIRHLALFGSVARNEAREESDIDIILELDPSHKTTLVTLARLQQRLTDILGKTADVSTASWMKDHIREQALREAIGAF